MTFCINQTLCTDGSSLALTTDCQLLIAMKTRSKRTNQFKILFDIKNTEIHLNNLRFFGLKMISILFFVSYWPLIWCTDWCEIIAPNKTYKGLSIYNRYDSSGLRQNWMRNKEGSMWKVNFTFDQNGPLDFIMDDTIETFLKRNVIQMFSISYKRQDIYYNMNCEMYSNRLECVYHNLKEDKDYYNQILANKLNPNFLYVKPYPSQRHDSSLIEISKKDRNSRAIVRLEPTRIEYMVCNDICYSIPLVERMNSSLFARIDSIVDYEDKANNRFGHILLFNINGRPYYCTQPENQSLSEEV